MADTLTSDILVHSGRATEYDSIKAVARFVYATYDDIYQGSYDKTAALSVRCVKDD